MDDLSKHVRMMDEKIGRMSNQIETLTQEVKDQETRHKNATKELRQIILELNAKISQLEDQLQNQVAPGSQPASTLTPTLSPKTYAQATIVAAGGENEIYLEKSITTSVIITTEPAKIARNERERKSSKQSSHYQDPRK